MCIFPRFRKFLSEGQLLSVVSPSDGTHSREGREAEAVQQSHEEQGESDGHKAVMGEHSERPQGGILVGPAGQLQLHYG